MGSISTIEPTEYYRTAPLTKGLLEGYNTMDALAGLAFGIVVINVIRSLGVKDTGGIAICTVRSGLLACLLMAVIYSVTVLAGAQSRNIYELASNGGIVLSDIARHYFSDTGAYLLAAMIFIACLKTAIGLIISCSEAFSQMFPNLLNYKKWAILFSLMSFVFANIGLSGIIKLSIPVLMMLYPLSITLIFLVLTEKYFQKAAPFAFKFVTIVTFSCSFLDFLRGIAGLGWICPALIAFIAALVFSNIKKSPKDF